MLTLSDVTTDDIPSTPAAAKTEGLISDSAAHAIQTAVEVGLLPVLVVCGVTMNGFNMAVFLRQGLSDRINLCLFSLAISDTGYITFLLTSRIHSIVSLFDRSLGRYLQFRALHLVGVYAGFLSTSNCLTLYISLERCLLVVSPLKARNLLSLRFMAVLIVLTFCTCLSCLGIFGWKFDVISDVDPVTNVTIHRPVFTQFYLDNRDPVEFLFQAFNAVVPVIAFTGVVIATSIIAVRMRAVSAWRKKSASVATTKEASEASLTRMLFAVCVLYTVCSLPTVVRPLVTMLVYEFQPGMRYENTMFSTISLMHFMSAVNSSVNFLIYFVMSTRFRDTFRGMVGREGRGAELSVESLTKTSSAAL